MPYRLATPQRIRVYKLRLQSVKVIMGWMMGLEPTAPRATIWCSSLLSYTHHVGLLESNGVPGGIRTPDLRIRSPLLYPAELQGQQVYIKIEPPPPAGITQDMGFWLAAFKIINGALFEHTDFMFTSVR